MTAHWPVEISLAHTIALYDRPKLLPEQEGSLMIAALRKGYFNPVQITYLHILGALDSSRPKVFPMTRTTPTNSASAEDYPANGHLQHRNSAAYKIPYPALQHR
ncbi:hypothetical protein GB937_004333 [Aspergillus fischeri]|nr:hypothetical protein GB937_004333 [Aspergillus fischeri]